MFSHGKYCDMHFLTTLVFTTRSVAKHTEKCIVTWGSNLEHYTSRSKSPARCNSVTEFLLFHNWVASCWWFTSSHITMHGSMNIKHYISILCLVIQMSKFYAKRSFSTPNGVPKSVVSYVTEYWITAKHSCDFEVLRTLRTTVSKLVQVFLA
jgi:hypothetical protein